MIGEYHKEYENSEVKPDFTVSYDISLKMIVDEKLKQQYFNCDPDFLKHPSIKTIKNKTTF